MYSKHKIIYRKAFQKKKKKLFNVYKGKSGAGEMAQQEKALAAKPA